MQFQEYNQLCDYQEIWQKMLDFTDNRNPNTLDEIWLLEHSPVYTLGQAGKIEHLLNPTNIPVVKSDRGGQITYHGPGLLMIYCLLDLKRNKLGVRELVNRLENTIITLLKQYNISANSLPDKPGVYVNNKKICSIGLRIRKGASLHGLCLNINANLDPFLNINPCGYKDLAMTQIKDFVPNITLEEIKQALKPLLRTLNQI